MVHHARSELTRSRIESCAAKLFRDRGFEKTTMRDVAKGAALPVSVLYYYFPDKEALYARVMGQELERVFKGLHGHLVLDGSRSLPEVLADLVEVRTQSRLSAADLELYRVAALEQLGVRGETPLCLAVRKGVADRKAFLKEKLLATGLLAGVSDGALEGVIKLVSYEALSEAFGLSTFNRTQTLQAFQALLRPEEPPKSQE